VLTEGVIPRYLSRRNLDRIDLGQGIRALIRVRCGNLGEWNKYWIEERKRKYNFCNKGRDELWHYIENCKVMVDWFRKLGRNKEQIWKKIWSKDLNEGKKETSENMERKG